MSLYAVNFFLFLTAVAAARIMTETSDSLAGPMGPRPALQSLSGRVDIPVHRDCSGRGAVTPPFQPVRLSVTVAIGLSGNESYGDGPLSGCEPEARSGRPNTGRHGLRVGRSRSRRIVTVSESDAP